MTVPAPQHLVEMILTLYEDRQFWRTEANRGAPTARCGIAECLATDALLEDMARRGGPTTAREYSERDWLREGRDPEILEANRIARAEHRSQFPAKLKRARRTNKRLAAWEYNMQVAIGGASE